MKFRVCSVLMVDTVHRDEHAIEFEPLRFRHWNSLSFCILNGCSEMFRGLKIAKVCYLLQCFGVGSQRYEIFVVESPFCKGGLWPPWKLRWLWNRRSRGLTVTVLFVIECLHVETLKVDKCLLTLRQMWSFVLQVTALFGDLRTLKDKLVNALGMVRSPEHLRPQSL